VGFPGVARGAHEAELRHRGLARQGPGVEHDRRAARFAIDRSGTRFYIRGGEPVAQLVEHLTFNQVVLGSSPSGLTSYTIEIVDVLTRSPVAHSLIDRLGNHWGTTASDFACATQAGAPPLPHTPPSSAEGVGLRRR
jgi:hypothetical protein